MVPLISQPPAGPSATEGPAAPNPGQSQHAGDAFESAMNHALGENHPTSPSAGQRPQRSSGAKCKSTARIISKASNPTVQPESEQNTSVLRPAKATGHSGPARPSATGSEASVTTNERSVADSCADLGCLQVIAARAAVDVAVPVQVFQGSPCVGTFSAPDSLVEPEAPADNKPNSEQAKSNCEQATGRDVLPQPVVRAGVSGLLRPQQQSNPSEQSPAMPAPAAQGTKDMPAARAPGELKDFSPAPVHPPTSPGSELATGSSPPSTAELPSPFTVAASPFTRGSGGDDPQASFGTSAAQYEVPMKKAEKMQKIAELPQQNLPGDGAVSAARPESPAGASSAAVATAGSVEQADNRTAALERTHDLVAMHALRVSHSSNEAIRVVIEPGGGTRLSLELRFNNGNVDAQAVLHRGDFEFLNQHWGELQQRLDGKGVQLGTLECSDQFSTDQHHSQRSGGQSSDDAPSRNVFAEFVLDGSIAEAANRPSGPKTYLGWETWA